MIKYAKNIFWGYLLILMFLFTFDLQSYASVGALNVRVRTVIENIDEAPAEVRTKSFNYNIIRTVNMYRIEGKCLVPNDNSPKKGFSWKHGQISTISFNGIRGNTSYDILLFQSAANTDAHVSLSRIEYAGNTRAYTYNDGGRANTSVTPFNWAEIINSNSRSAELTLYFRYNPDIGELGKAPDPEVSYSKQIDYLGDGGGNPDTSAGGPNDYRLYLSLATEETAKEKDKDIVFLLDVSNSMTAPLGTATRFDHMKSTLASTIGTLTQNPNNRISIIRFGTNTQTLISHSSDKAGLKQIVDNMALPGGSEGGTNYYSAFKEAGSILAGLNDPGRETVVFFLTDGLPTSALPAVNAVGYTKQYEVALPYAVDAASAFPKTDRFYSVFIGDSPGDASGLQTVTQKIDVSIEKYMVHVSSPEQLKNTFDRFLSRVGGLLFDVKIEDELSEYVDYAGESKVVRIKGGNESRLLASTDYRLSVDASSKKVILELIGNTVAGARYVLSFNVRANDNALVYYDVNKSYPHIGDEGTDYRDNVTSSMQPGFYSNAQAVLRYKFDGGHSAEKLYPKPVIQVVAPPAIPVVIEGKKELTGMDLEADQFEFELYEEAENGEKKTVSSAKNDENGNIVFDSLNVSRPGNYRYFMREIIPAAPQPGMTYDETVFEIEVKIEWIDNELKATEINYKEVPVFKNNYEAAPVIVTIEALKELEGRALASGEFEFTLTQNGAVIGTARNGGDGKVSFDPITISMPNEYEYMIREVPPIPSDPHIIYDVAPRKVKVKVWDAGGRLQADVSYEPDNIFKNKFQFRPVQPVIQLKKVLYGMRLEGASFSFQLEDLSTGEKTVVSNNNQGEIIFSDIIFSAPGTYLYEVRELLPDHPNEYMTYDTEKVIQVTVTVSDDGTGDLQADVDFSEDPVFYNYYKVRGGIW